MNGWDISLHTRKVTKWNPEFRKSVSLQMNTVEARKKFGEANVLITARHDGTFVSMNGPAKMTSSDLDDMCDVMDRLVFLLKDRPNDY